MPDHIACRTMPAGATGDPSADRKSESAGDDAWAMRALETLPFGVAVIGERGGVVYANGAMRSAASSGGPTVTRAGLRTRHAGDQGGLEAAMRRVLSGSPGGGPLDGGRHRVRLQGDAGCDWVAEAMPLLPGMDGCAGALVVLSQRPADRFAVSPDVFARLGLTSAEAALAVSLAQGMTVSEHARIRGIAVSTARTHLARIRDKTGARRQADLVRLLMSVG